MRTLLLLSFLLLAGCSSKPPNVSRENQVIHDPDHVPIKYLTTGLDQLPVIKRGKIPSHPDSESWSRGFARVRFTIDERGRTKDIEVLESSGKSFGGNTAYAIRFWRFEPAVKDGEPTSCEAIVGFQFRGQHFGGVNE